MKNNGLGENDFPPIFLYTHRVSKGCRDVKLKRLIIQGFKSFKDKTVVNFDDGITGIVGPNGCGKSNIVDALFWVMGEQSAKHLRGASMKDLIFSGSSKYSPAVWAEVSLVLENDTGKHIHILNKVSKPSEIQLTRKLYRNGETEYRINGVPARLKDIQEVFMDTGAGAKSYSIIAQGEIDRLVRAKPQERRVMIEEVAGITKFKLRRRESLKKIEQTENNLNRLRDLENEIEKNLKSLHSQAEKAQRARTLKEKIKRHDLIVNSHKEYGYLKDFQEWNTFISEKRLDLVEWTNTKSSLELSLEEERIKKTELTESLDCFQEEFNEMSKQLAASSERLNYLKKSTLEKGELITSRRQESLELVEEAEERREKLEQLIQEKNAIEDSAKEEVDFESFEERVLQLKENLTDKEEEVALLKTEIDKIKGDIQSNDNNLYRNNSKSEEYAKALEDISLEIESIESQNSNVSQSMLDDRDEVNQLASRVESHSLFVEQAKEELNKLVADQRQLDLEYKEKSKNIITLESKIGSLKEIQESLEGVKEGAKKFLKSDCSEGYQIFGNLIRCSEEYTKSVQGLLGDYFDSIVCQSDDIKSLQDWCRINEGVALDVLIPLNVGSVSDLDVIERLKVNGCKDVLPLKECISLTDSAFEARFANFFNGYYLVSNLTEELFNNLPKDIGFNGIVSLDGKIVIKKTSNAKLLGILGNVENTQGVVERNNLIIELSAKFEVEKIKFSDLEARLIAADDLLNAKKISFEDARNELSEIRAEFAAKKSALESREHGFHSTNKRFDILVNRKADISRSRLVLIEEDEELSQKGASLKADLLERQELLEDQSADLESMLAIYNDEKDELSEKKIIFQTFETRIQSIKSQIADIEKYLERVELKKESNEELLEKYTSEIEQAALIIEELESSNSSVVDELKEREAALSDRKDDLAQLLLGMHERENEVRKLSSNLTKVEKELVEKELKVEQIINDEVELVKNIFEKYQVDLRDSIIKFFDCTCEQLDVFESLVDLSSVYKRETENGIVDIEKEDYAFIRKYGQELSSSRDKFRDYKVELNRLGEINWRAVEDYDRQKLRYDFIKQQEVELKKSLEDLQQAINQIDEKSQVRFKEAFQEVDERFQKVFPIIFGGGCARLEAVGDFNDPEFGINIWAQPPGKKNQAVNLLSGGEKALTALSLIFSIFLVKPSPFCLLDEVDAPLDDANVGRFNELLREMSNESQFVLITHNKKTMELNDILYGVTMQEPGVSKAVSVQLQ